MPHNLRKCSASRIRAIVYEFIQAHIIIYAHMDFEYSGYWTVQRRS